MVIIIKLTLDNLYDQKLTKKSKLHNPNYQKIEQVLMVLKTKISYFPEDDQDNIYKLVKGMAFISMSEEQRAFLNKVTVQELIDGLDLNVQKEYVREMLCRLREITGGQFINQFSEDCFGLDLIHCRDYDQVVREKASFLSREDETQGLLHFLQQCFGLDNSKKIDENIFFDYFLWPACNSYQKVSVVFNESCLSNINSVLLFNITSNIENTISYEEDSSRIIIYINYNQHLAQLIRELIIVDNYRLSSNYPSSYLKWKKNYLSKKIEESLAKILDNFSIIFPDYKGEKNRQVCSLQEFYADLKSDLFNRIFKQYYLDHPVFSLEITPANIKDIVELVIVDLLTENYHSTSREVLQSLAVLDQYDNPDISSSLYMEKLIQHLKEEKEEVIPIERIILELNKKPYGLQKEFIYLLLVILVYMGIIELYRDDQVRIGVKGVENIFLSHKSLFRKGLDVLEDINGYIRLKENDLNNLQPLFSILGITGEFSSTGYLPYLIFKEYNKKVQAIKQNVEWAKIILENYLQIPVPVINQDIIKEKIKALDKYTMNKLFGINTIEGLQKLSFDKLELEELEISLKYINNLVKFLDYFNQNVMPDYRQLYERFKTMESHDELNEVVELIDKTWQRVDQYKQLIVIKKLITKLLLGKN